MFSAAAHMGVVARIAAPRRRIGVSAFSFGTRRTATGALHGGDVKGRHRGIVNQSGIALT